MSHTKSIVLLGHSCSGKSPTGAALAAWLNAREVGAFHFDFGSCLRDVASGNTAAGLSSQQCARVVAVMDGRVLGEHDRDIALGVLTTFMARNMVFPDREWLICNGLPRTIAQAGWLVQAGVLPVVVLFLDCSVPVARERKRLAEMGKGHEDRSDRPDKDEDIFIRKTESFRRETLPLVEWYSRQGVSTVTVPVHVHTTPEQIIARAEPLLLAHAVPPRRQDPAR